MRIYKHAKFYIGRTDLYNKILFKGFLSEINELIKRGICLDECKKVISVFSDVHFDNLNNVEIEIGCDYPVCGLKTLDKVVISLIISSKKSFRYNFTSISFRRIEIANKKFIKLGDIHIRSVY